MAVPFYGTAILCLDNEEIQNMIPLLKKRYITYGMTSQADLQARDMKGGSFNSDFEVFLNNNSLGRVVVGMPGEHNMLNALAAIAVGLELEISMKDIRESLQNLGGLERRFQIKEEKKGILVMDDYGHHPTEILATLETAKKCWPERRLVVLFQPHRYSRTKALFDRFVISFNQADVLIVAPIYAAGEKPIEGMDSELLFRGIKAHGHREVRFCHQRDEIIPLLLEMVQSGDIVLTLGAGDIHMVGNELLETLG